MNPGENLTSNRNKNKLTKLKNQLKNGEAIDWED